MTAYKLENVCKSFDMPTGSIIVLKDLSLEVQEGEWLALTGRSGSGKTTLLQLLGGLDKPTSGRIFLGDTDLTTAKPAKIAELRHKRIGFIFQSYHLFPELNSLENAMLPALRWGADRAAAAKAAREWLERFGLGKRIQHRPRELSGGEQQRVAIARAMINQPDIILADEPTGNLDKKAADDIIRIIDDIRKDMKKTLVMVTHDQDIAAKADRIFAMK
ncbi:MAG: ABC transporter ATP-binding protein [Victivallales bacterium]|nr:ABC transporter ATP-binding protein [Victivallales bacterium]